MGAMVSALASIAYIALYVFFIAMWVRFIFDWVRVLSRNFRPKGVVLMAAEAAYTVTDKPLAAVRRVIPTLRFGGAGIDLGWSALMIGTLIMMSVVGAFR
ncbi:YggT family protein [Pontimonas sp.]|jgi:YggT family protein|nr:YggT family protein [Pontimonas sp.]